MTSSLSKILPLLLVTLCSLEHLQAQVPSDHTVTASEYADFLNQNAASDPDHLFDEKMASDTESACIIRFGTPEKCHYEVIAGRENFPVPYINEERAAAYGAAMNLEQESHHEDFFLASNQRSFSVVINNPLAELSLRISDLSSDSHYLESGSRMAIIGTLGMIVMGMVGREEPVHEPITAAPSRNTLAEPTSPYYECRMDNVRPTTGNTPPIITEIEHQLPASERTTGIFQGTSITVPETRSLEARGLTDDERAEQERAFWQSERDASANRERAHSPEDDLKISADDVTSVSKNTGASVSVSSQDSQRDSTDLINSPASASKRPYRFREGGWEEKIPNGSWEPTDRFNDDDLSQGVGKTARNFSQEDADMLSKVTDRFIDSYNGCDRILQKTNRLKDELAKEQQQPSPNEEKCNSLLKRIELLQEADKKERERINKLVSPRAESIPKQISDSIDRFRRAEETSSMAYNHFELEELALDCLQQSINRDNPKDSVWVREIVEEPRYSFDKAAHEAKKDTPNQQVIDWFIRSAELYQQAVIAFDERKPGYYLADAGRNLAEAAEEAQKPQPKQQVIDWFTRGAELNQQAATALDAGQTDKAMCLSNAACNLNSAAREAQKPQPNQDVIDCFTRSAELSQQAATELDEGQTDKASHLEGVNYSLIRAAEEAQEPRPNQQVIDWFTRGAELDQQAATALDEGQKDKAICLNNAACSLIKAAREALQPQPNQQVIDWYTRGAELYQQAVTALDKGQRFRALYRAYAAYRLRRAAEKARDSPLIKADDF